LTDDRIIYGVYIDHDVNLVPQLIELLENQIGIQKGITLYRIAKLFFFKNDNETARKYLLESRQYLNSTTWKPIVDLALKDISILMIK